MLINILSDSNKVSYNFIIAKMIGLHNAIYLNQLITINEKAIRKNKIEEGYFKIDRAYITSVTTFSIQEQKELDKALVALGIINLKDSNYIKLNIDTLISLMNENNESINADIKTILTKSKTKRTKSETIIEQLKSSIICENLELRDSYYDWIDCVYAKQGWMSKKSIILGQQIVNDFANHNLDLALEIINIAAVNGYRDMEWAVNKYNTLPHKVSNNISNTKVKVAGDIF